MLLLIKKLVTEYTKPYLYVFAIGLVMRIMVNLFTKVEVLQAINGLWIMISATLLIILSTYFLYEFLYTRHKYFYYTIKYSKLSILLIIAIILTVFNFTYYFIYTDVELWDVFQKLISLLVYFITTCSLLYSFRNFSSKKLGSNSFIFTLVSFLVTQSLIFYGIFSEQIYNKFMIGASSVADARNIYINIVPITLFVDNSTYLELSRFSVGFNVLLLMFFFLLLLIIRKIKINW
ncbi:hypothetical protein [Streptococcus sp. 121]|uniref:hypothetical protein n=1 Tax=Streptococcus sp. 121 TaxID=2797637 RepID=UPI0018F06224|nr:hypothetical protein [Streptococcus sp. 121]